MEVDFGICIIRYYISGIF